MRRMFAEQMTEFLKKSVQIRFFASSAFLLSAFGMQN